MTPAKRKKIHRAIYFTVLITLIASVIYTLVRLCIGIADETQRSDYSLMLLQCCLGLCVLFVPDIIQKRFSKELPSHLTVLYYIFLYCAIYLGEVRSFYYLIPYWDSILHGFSAGMLGVFGFWLVDLLNENARVRVTLSPLFVSLFAFCFALTVGCLWEMYEFLGDGLFGMNMQKFREADGTVLIGHAALSDTMKDLMIDGAGALIIALLGYFVNTKRKKESRND